jgi:hypothetical protein
MLPLAADLYSILSVENRGGALSPHRLLYSKGWLPLTTSSGCRSSCSKMTPAGEEGWSGVSM